MKRSLFITLTSFSLLAACGGGGNGLGGGNQPAALIKLNSGNAVTATKVSYAAARATADVGDLAGETGFIAGAGGVAKVRDVVAATGKTAGESQVPIPPTEVPCDLSGTITISGDIADIVTPTLTPGDFFDIEFDMCNDGLGDVIDGDLHFEVDAFAGDFLGGLYDLTMTMTLTDFQITTPTDVVTSNGDATVTLNTVNSPSVSASVNGNSLTVDTNTSSEALTNFASTQTLDAGIVPSPFTLTALGTLDSTQLSGSVRYSTPVMFEGFDDDYPGAGEFFVQGDDSSARLIAESNVNVRIELDTDGDGGVDETINTTWAELTGS